MLTRAPIVIPFAAMAVLVAAVATRAQEPVRTGPQTESRFPPLVVPPGFKATLFACDPLIEYPSAIAAGPRPGAIFVAVDYMTGLGTEIIRRSEVRLVEDTSGDGYAHQAPVFADGFNSIQGLAWHDGTLFVMHAPCLTALRDTQGSGKADQRINLLSGLGLTPEDNPVRLHCANGVVVGHDGWLYLALGDHGCDVQRPEGDRLVLQGGGIVRCRPDGRDLHVFATGLRNIYDVALDAELNVFVRDNENDGGTYKIRVCHSFHGADHGYPYLYEDRQREAMPPLTDLGLGSSAGGACYLETQFAKEYRGNLLFCEWGKAVVRYPLHPLGSGFERPAELEFATGAKDDPYGFKPTDLIVQRDGTLMVSDYADGQRPKRGRGRIYNIAYVGNGTDEILKQKPPATEDATDDWLARLDSESYFARCDAQKAIQGQGQTGLQKLSTALAERRLGVSGRLHAVWILAGSGGPSAIDDLFKLAVTDPEPKIRAQAIRAIADLADPVLVRHRLDAAPGDAALAARLAAIERRKEPKVLLEVCIALARQKWPATVDWLKDNVHDPDPPLVHAAMQALRRSSNWPATLQLLDQPDNSPLRAIALAALAERYEREVVDGLIERLRATTSASRRQEYSELLTRVYKKPGPWTYWGYRPPPRPANTVAWEQTETIGTALDHSLASFDPAARLVLLRHMQREQIPVPAATLTHWLANELQPERVADILTALRDHPPPEIRSHLAAVIKDPRQSLANRQTALKQFGQAIADLHAEELLTLARAIEDGPVLAAALRLLPKHPKLDAATLLATKLRSPAPEVRAAAIASLGDLRLAVDHKPLLALLADDDAGVRCSAAATAGKLAAKEAIEPLLKLANDVEPSVRQSSLEALGQLRAERALPIAVAALRDSQVNTKALACVRQVGGPAHAAAVADLAKHNPSAEILNEAIRTLTDWRNRPATSTATVHELDSVVAEIQGATGVLVRWHVSGPISAESLTSTVERLSSNLLDGDGSGGRKMIAVGTEARLTLASKDIANNGSWLAQTTLSVAEPTEVEFLASSGGALRVWLNGHSVYHRDEPRSFQVDSERFSGTLRTGDNRLVVAITRPAAPVEFHLRLRRKSATVEHERLAQAALSRVGNADRGRQMLLNTEKSQCLKCHRVGEQGERTGPELTGVGSRFSRVYIVESILEPSRTIAPSFGTLSVLLKNGLTLSGVKTLETPTDVTLVDNKGQKQVAAKSEIETQQPSPISTMPEGLEKRFTEQEFVDLIAHLMSLKESRVP